MEPSEFRIGNWVKVENDYERVVAIDTYNIKCSLDGVEGVWQHKRDVCPISLTEKLLIKFGFRKKGKYYYDEDKSIRIDRNSNDTIFFVSMGYDTISLDQKETVWIIINDVKFVHELQNLYYALTKTELIFKI